MFDKIKAYVAEFVRKNNYYSYYREPLVGYTSANNIFFTKIKQITHPQHYLPKEILENARSVVAYFIPFSEFVVRSNIDNKYASELWAKVYIHCNALIETLNRNLSDFIEQHGFQCKTISATHNFDDQTLVSYWSHKHIAYICGLGTLGLHNMLITSKGCCGRLSSMVTNIPATNVPETKDEYCLYKRHKTCMMCVKRCVNQSLQTDTFNRFHCYEQCLLNEKRYEHFGKADVCGKCMVGVPCSISIPNTKSIMYEY